jgi:hypothetical protein
MGLLKNLFDPIVNDPSVRYDQISIAAIDTIDTLVRKEDGGYVPNHHIPDLFRALTKHKERLGLKHIFIVSGAPTYAATALNEAGLHDLARAEIKDKNSFLFECSRSRNEFILIDDEVCYAFDAAVFINPNSKKVKSYLETEPYKDILEVGRGMLFQNRAIAGHHI